MGWLRWGASRHPEVVNTVPRPSLSIAPPSSTKSVWSSYAPSISPAAYRLRFMALSFAASNLSPQPLKRKSSNLLRLPSVSEMNAWSRAQVSSVGQARVNMLRMMASPASRLMAARASSGSGATMSSRSRRAISLAICTYVAVISPMVGCQSVSLCGHVSCTKSCASHSAGSRQR